MWGWFDMALADLIKEARARKRNKDGKPWTQDDLAEAMGVSRGYIGQVETGLIRRPRPPYRRLFLDTLNLSEEEWLRSTGELPPREAMDVEAEIRRIAAIQDLDDQAAELELLEQTHPALIRLMEAMAMRRAREAFRPGR